VGKGARPANVQVGSQRERVRRARAQK